MKASSLATTMKSSSDCVSLAAFILPLNSSTSANGWFSPPINELVFGKSLSSMHTAAMSRCSNFFTSLRMLLKLPYPVSPSNKMGIVVASLINSSTSKTCVQEASLLSRTPRAAEMERPLPQIPLKPASSTIFADNPLCASIRKAISGELTIDLSCVVFFILKNVFKNAAKNTILS